MFKFAQYCSALALSEQGVVGGIMCCDRIPRPYRRTLYLTVPLLIAIFFWVFFFRNLHTSSSKQSLRRGVVVSEALKCPLLAEQGFEAQILLSELFEGLVTPDKEGTFAAGVAKSWESRDERLWRFHLDPKARWSDGVVVSAQDFVWASHQLFERAQRDPHCRDLLENLLESSFPILNGREILRGERPISSLGMRALNARELEIELVSSRRSRLVLSALSEPYFFPRPTHLPESMADDLSAFVGNGPFKVAKLEIQNAQEDPQRPFARWHLRKNEHFRRARGVRLEAVEYLFFSSDLACQKAWERREIDLFYASPSITREPAIEAHLWWSGADRRWDLVPNLQDPILKKCAVREVLSQIFDRALLCQGASPGSAPRYGLVNISNRISWLAPPWQQDSEEERQEWIQEALDKLGYSAQNPLELEVLYSSVPLNFLNACQFFEQRHPEIHFILKPVSKEEQNIAIQQQQFQLYLREEFSPAHPCLHYPSLITGHAKNINGVENFLEPNHFFDFISQSGSVAYDAKFYQDVESKFLRLWPIVPLMTEPCYLVASPDLEGIAVPSGHLSGRVSSKNLYFKNITGSSQAIDHKRIDNFCARKQAGLVEEEAYLFFW